MYAWYQRRKRELLGMAAIGAAGAAAAYCAYRWYWQDTGEPAYATASVQQDQAREHAEREGAMAVDAEAETPSTPPDPVAQLEERMRLHFEKLQDIGDQDTLPELQQHLRARLEQLVDRDSITLQLRNAKNNVTPLSADQKLALWKELRRRCFLLLIAATWAVPALNLLTHIHLTILGRHLYLETVMRGRSVSDMWRMRFPASPSRSRQSGHDSPPQLPPVSDAQQDALLSYTEFFVNEGLEELLACVVKVVDAHLHDVSIEAPFNLQQVWQLLSDMHSGVEAVLALQDWSEWLVPPILVTNVPGNGTSAYNGAASTGIAGADQLGYRTPGQRAADSQAVEACCRLPDPYQPIGISDPLEVEVITEMLLEVREAVRSRMFSTALEAAVMSTAEIAAEDVQAHFSNKAPGTAHEVLTTRAFPLATIVPWVSQAGQALLVNDAHVRQSISALQEIHKLYATVYAKGPRAF